MRKKLQQLADGTFDYRKPNISFSIERVELEVIEGKDQTGEFTIKSSEGRKLRGMVYSTYSRMECLTPQFEGEEIKIRYQFHSRGLVEGDVRKGEFVIVCDQGEYNLSFAVSVAKAYAKTSIGIIKNLSDFVNLAQKNKNEAYQIFYSLYFPYLLKEAGEKETLLYEAIRKETPSMQAVEAYLVGIGKKPSVQVVLEEKKHIFNGVTFDCREKICIKKENWGYLFCEVKTDAAFIQLKKTSITEEDFLGNTYFLEYDIKADELHAGDNFGKIFFEFPEQTLVCEIIVKTNETESSEKSFQFLQMQDRIALMKLYTNYRTKKIVTGMWANQSIEKLNHLLEMNPKEDVYRLMKAQIFLFNRQRQEASWILNDYKRSCGDKNTPEWGYYLYLCTLMEREESYVNRLAAEIEELFLIHPESSLLFWVLLFVREEYYKSSAKRLRAIEHWIEKGNDSPFFYLEAFYLYCQEPHLLNKLERFELKILNWAAKQKAFSKEVVNQILSLLPTLRSYDEKVYRILTVCYETVESEEVVTAICSYLIKGQKFAKNYHKWYALGVKQEIRITNLYEAYLLSADKESIANVPKSVFMYFQYHHTLDYKRIALLYATIINQKENHKLEYVAREYQNYKEAIKQFAIEQVQAGHIDENLSIIYHEIFSSEILSPQFFVKKTLSSPITIPKFLIPKVSAQEVSKQEILNPETLNPEILENEIFNQEAFNQEAFNQEAFNQETFNQKGSKQEILTPEMSHLKFWEGFSDILFVHRLQMKGEKGFARAVIVQKQWNGRQVVPIIDGTAYFHAYTEDYCILLLDSKGRVFAEKTLYEEYPLLEVSSYLDMLKEYASEEIKYLVYSFAKKQKENVFSIEDAEAFLVLMNKKEAREEWKSVIFPAYVKEMAANKQSISLEDCFKKVNYKAMSVLDRCFMTEQLIENHLFEQAYELFYDYGYDFVGKDSCVAVCSYQITNINQEEDEFLLGLASDTFISGKYNVIMLEYLCQYYNGPTKQMTDIFLAADELRIDTYDLEERILTQMLYSSDYLEQADRIYEAYCQKNPKELISNAYLSYFSHLYLTKDMVTAKQVFLQIERSILLQQEIAKVQNYALLKYYSEQETLTDGQYKAADMLLEKNTANQIYFGFYKKLDARLIRKYLLQNKYFVQYHSTPKACVTISYYKNQESCLEEAVKEVYAGIFVKEFSLFWGDQISYYITEAEENKERKTTLSGQIVYEDTCEDKDSRYGMLNDICHKIEMQEEKQAEKLMREYSRKKQMTEQMFSLL